jgi:hypothetical protein
MECIERQRLAYEYFTLMRQERIHQRLASIPGRR